MLRIEKHIEKLLLEHDCVIVPDLGGFVVQTMPTNYQADTYLFEPAHKEVVFNQTLQHNDGLLIESYMQEEQVDYKQARQLVINDVAALRSELQEQGTYSLGNVGIFSLGEENQLVFQASDAEWLNQAMFGLPSFVFEPLSVRFPAASVVEEKPKDKEVYYIPVSRRFLHAVVASVAIIVLLLSISTPVKDVNRAAYSASFVPTEMIPSSAWKNQDISSAAVPAQEASVVEKPVASVVKETEQPKEITVSHNKSAEKKEVVVAPKVKETPKPAAKEVKPLPQKYFYVVIASFPTASQADTYLKEVDRQVCRHSDVVQNGKKYRVYADRFTDRSAAESFMENLRKDKRYKDAWLFINR